jgi:hypothetical protein
VAIGAYLLVGLIWSLFATTTWPKDGVVWPALVFIQNMVLWPIGLAAYVLFTLNAG